MSPTSAWLHQLKDGLLFLEEPRALGALLSWPIFSFTSYRMVGALARKRLAPRTIVDVGANVGQFSVAAAKVFPNARIHAFEPVPGAAAQLRAHTARLPAVTVYSVALGEEPGTATTYVSANSVSSSLLRSTAAHTNAFPEASAAESIQVPVTTLDLALAGASLERPVLLKLDVQGYEAQTLRGGAHLAGATAVRAPDGRRTGRPPPAPEGTLGVNTRSWLELFMTAISLRQVTPASSWVHEPERCTAEISRPWGPSRAS